MKQTQETSEDIIPVMYGRRISKISENLEDYPPGTVWMTIGELEKLKQSRGKGDREEIIYPPQEESKIPVLNGCRLRSKSDNLEDYPPGTVWMTVGEWVRSRTETSEKENIAPSPPNPTVNSKKPALNRTTRYNYPPTSPTPPKLNIHQLIEEHEPKIKLLVKALAQSNTQQFLKEALPESVSLSEEQLAILQQQLEIELYECLEGKFSWGFNRAIRSVADPQSLSLPSSFSHLDPEDF